MSVVAGDSIIALCWATTENKPMAIFHRNRALQIRSSLNLEDLYHVRTHCNPSDVGTRPAKVTMKDIGPDSRSEQGDPWMRLPLDAAIEQGYIKTASSLRVKNGEEEDEYRKGIIFEKVPEILTRGHVVNERRVGLMEERANFSKYLILPTKFSFPKVVRILSYVMSFISKARKNQRMNGEFLFEGQQRFSAFHGQIRITDEDSSLDVSSQDSSLVSRGLGFLGCGNLMALVTSDLSVDAKQLYMKTQLTRVADVSNLELDCSRYINLALLYLYRKASCEIKHFWSFLPAY